jgi:hypothetical protein
MELHVRAAHEGKRRDEEFAELLVGDPRCADAQRLKRKRIDPHRPAAFELHVECGRVLERHSEAHGGFLQA